MHEIHPGYPDYLPMLSGKFKSGQLELDRLVNFPYVTSPKVDGYRCIIGDDGKPYTRSLKLVPNVYIQKRIEFLTRFNPLFKFLDGELVYGSEANITEPNVFQATSSAVTSHAGEPNVTYWVFDRFGEPKKSYTERFMDLYSELYDAFNNLNAHFDGDADHKIKFQLLPYHIATTVEDLEAREDEYVTQGFEGMCFRDPTKPYHFNRSSVSKNSQHLIKLTRWETNELIITGTEELQENANELTRDERGYAKRSTAKAGKIGRNTLGKFIGTVLNGPFKGEELRVGTGDGLTFDLRDQYWAIRDSLPGQIVTFKWRPHGSKELPRFPIYKGLRAKEDMS